MAQTKPIWNESDISSGHMVWNKEHGFGRIQDVHNPGDFDDEETVSVTYLLNLIRITTTKARFLAEVYPVSLTSTAYQALVYFSEQASVSIHE